MHPTKRIDAYRRNLPRLEGLCVRSTSSAGSGRRAGRNTDARSAGSELRIELSWCRRRSRVGGGEGSTGGRADFSEGGGIGGGGSGGWSALSFDLELELGFGLGLGLRGGSTTNANGLALAFERGLGIGVAVVVVISKADSNRGVGGGLLLGVVKPSGPCMTRRRFGGREVLIVVPSQVA
ncbi:hypothetical protein EDD18DRAFT_1158972, partial [Armillaria luteobubalina]